MGPARQWGKREERGWAAGLLARLGPLAFGPGGEEKGRGRAGPVDWAGEERKRERREGFQPREKRSLSFYFLFYFVLTFPIII